jgi:cysteine desulfurase
MAIYLDYAAATPVDPRVVDAMQLYWTERFYNPSALYLDAKAVHADIKDARAKVASILGAKPSEVVFTAGGTEANNLAVHGVMQQFPDTELIVSAIEHDSVLEPAKKYQAKLASVDERGVISLPELRNKITDKTVLVSVMLANNEVGSIQPVAEIARLLAQIKAERQKAGNKLPIYLHTDAAQATNYLDLHTSKLGVDLMTVNGGKIYGPKQSGLLFIKTGVQLSSQLQGGGQERGIRSGTENVASIVGFAKALELAGSRRKAEVERLKKLQETFVNAVQAKIPSAVINGSLKNRLPNNLHVTFPGKDNERLMMELDERGIQCATGSACSASSDEPSHVLKAMGISDADAQSSLRFTMGRQTTESDISKVVSALKDLIN